ncbi:MAG: prolipoprotein diacylglyceryl transferase [Candidatus Omnitrophica bacterium]|nr:prolipoprotein diacylglyceryl transferase [Candidatus Omnitrophota bacterium]
MHPIITKLGPITIYSYGMMVAIAFVLGIYVAGIEARRKGIKQDLVYDLMFYIVIGSLIAARFYYLAFFDPSVFIKSPLSIFKIWEGGVAIHGGILGGIIAGIVFSKLKKTSFWKLADLVAPSIILGQAIGRIGCFLNGCCYGVNNYPVQLYESFLNLLGFFVLWSMRKRLKFEGGLFLLYLMIYSSIRIPMSSLRGDSLYVWGTDLKIAQIISGVVFIIALVLFAKREKDA